MIHITSQHGFTLTETIVALAVFSIVTIFIIGAVSTTQAAQRNEHYLDVANTTAQQFIEDARDGHYMSLPGSPSGVSYDLTAQVPSDLPQGYATMLVTQSASTPNFKRLDVTVGYKLGTSYDRHVTQTAVIGAGGITP